MNVHRQTCGIVLLLTTLGAASAEGVKWRTDYNAARLEAQKQGLPIFIDFSTDWCGACKKLDASTFRDPAVVNYLNDNFIPLKLDGDKEARLVEALRIQAYPTLILAGPDGKIIKTMEGFRTANQLRDDLQEVLAAQANPDWMKRNYQDAAQAAQAGEFAQAVTLLQKILEDGRQRPMHWQSRLLLQDIEQQARVQLAKARKLEEGRLFPEAAAAYADVMQGYRGTSASADAARALAAVAERPEVQQLHRRKKAAELLARAKSDFRDREYAACLENCDRLVSEYANLPESEEAAQLLRELKGNPDLLKAACDRMSERLAALYLAQAEAWVLRGELQTAVECFKQVEMGMPGTRHAEAARIRLAQIQSRPVQQVDPPK